MTSRDMEDLLTCVLEKMGPISFRTLSNLIYIFQSYFTEIGLFIPLKFDYSTEGLLSDDLKFVLERLANKNIVDIDYSSPSIIRLTAEDPKRICPFIIKYSRIMTQMNLIIESGMEDNNVSQLAKLVRIQNIFELGMIPEEDIEKRILFDDIDTNSINDFVPLDTIGRIIPMIMKK